MAMTPAGLSIDDVEVAARRLRGRINRTPVITSSSFDDVTGCHVYFKCENLQRAGSFKIRGALNKVMSLSPAERMRGVVTYSSGNHGQGVALAAQMVDTTAIVCMPDDAPPLKIAATRAYGADIVFYDRLKDDREALARGIARDTGRVLVPPYDDYAVMAGQGTVALELVQEVPSLEALIVPVGGGGLMAGCSVVGRSVSPGMVLIGVEAESADDTKRSLDQGERVTIPPPHTIADGIRSTTPGELTFPILRENVNDIVLVSDDEIRTAVRFMALRGRVIVEPTGAVAVAALLAGRIPVDAGAHVGIVLSGGNIQPELLVSLLHAGDEPQ